MMGAQSRTELGCVGISAIHRQPTRTRVWFLAVTVVFEALCACRLHCSTGSRSSRIITEKHPWAYLSKLVLGLGQDCHDTVPFVLYTSAIEQ
jgi:hypothetical protein